MGIKYYYTIFITILLVGCSTPQNAEHPILPTLDLQKPTNSKIEVTTSLELPTGQLLTTTPPDNPQLTQTTTVTATTVPVVNVERKCLDIGTDIPSQSKLSGTVIFSAIGQDRRYLWDLDQRKQTTLQSDISSLSTSPNGDWWMYRKKENLFFSSKKYNIERSYIIKNNWLYYLPVWIDNEHVAITIDNHVDIPSTLIIDPVTNRQEILISNYPDLQLYYGTGGTNLHFIYSNVVYDPALNYVIYPKTVNNRYYITLWDRKNGRELSELEDDNYFYHNPVWLPDGKQFVEAVEKNNADELFLFNTKGQIEQLVYLGGTFPKNKIGAMSVAPNGNKLAFWKSTTDPNVIEELAVLDLSTKKVMDYCIPSTTNYGERPVWSSDGRFLIVKDIMETNHVRAIFIDTQDLWAAEIDKVYPSGWLANIN